jgi:geranylgeranyl reductase family protein
VLAVHACLHTILAVHDFCGDGTAILAHARPTWHAGPAYVNVKPISDVVIVGGGPAGLFTGWKLARAGHDVILFEEHPIVGEPVHCTGILAREAFDEFGLDPEAVLNPLRTVRFYAPSGDTVEYSTSTVEAVVIDRPVFDRALAREATHAGLRLAHGRVTSVTVDRDGVTVKTGTVIARARACVLACGANYALQRKLGFGMPELLMRSAQAELPADRAGDVEVHFGRHLAPGGFGWAVPVKRGDRSFVRVGVMCADDPGQHFARLLEQVTPRWGICRQFAPSPRQKILPLQPIACTYADRVLVVGDAAGLVKPTTGGGIYYSLRSAEIAATTLTAALERDELASADLSEYETHWRSQLDPELRSQLVLRRIAQRLSDEDIDGLFELCRTDGILPLIRRTAAFNHHREFIVALLKHPPARRLLFKTFVA